MSSADFTIYTPGTGTLSYSLIFSGDNSTHFLQLMPFTIFQFFVPPGTHTVLCILITKYMLTSQLNRLIADVAFTSYEAHELNHLCRLHKIPARLVTVVNLRK